jgi:hypothetical protein
LLGSWFNEEQRHRHEYSTTHQEPKHKEPFQKHENNFEIDIPENIVVLINHSLDAQTETASPVRMDTRILPKIGFSGGRFQTRR